MWWTLTTYLLCGWLLMEIALPAEGSPARRLSVLLLLIFAWPILAVHSFVKLMREK